MVSGRIPAKTLSFVIGFLSLGAETLWVRAATFSGQSTPKAFTAILGVYLAGIALGAIVGSRLCARKSRLGTILVYCLIAGSLSIVAGPFLLAWASDFLSYFGLPPQRLKAPMALALMPAFIFSICFPICHQIGTAMEEGRVGKSMSRVYAANIAGSVLGPLFVNFGLLAFATTQLAFVLLGLFGLLAAIGLVTVGKSEGGHRFAAFGAMATALVALVVANSPSHWLIAKLSDFQDLRLKQVVETRQGIVTAYEDSPGGDVIAGGNVYDGRTNLDPRLNSNGINRVLVLAALRPRAKRVLEIGLSVGTWHTLLTGFPGVERFDIVEINPGYLDLIKSYPPQRAAIENPRVNLQIGDGRKFLRQVRPASYDIILMNTSFHWRNYMSLLLSREFLELARRALADDGLLAYNATGSPDALKTAAAVFPHAYLYDNFVIAGFSDWRETLATPEAQRNLASVKAQGGPLFADTDGDIIQSFVSRARTRDLAVVERETGRPLEVITDRNLITEYKFGRR